MKAAHQIWSSRISPINKWVLHRGVHHLEVILDPLCKESQAHSITLRESTHILRLKRMRTTNHRNFLEGKRNPLTTFRMIIASLVMISLDFPWLKQFKSTRTSKIATEITCRSHIRRIQAREGRINKIQRLTKNGYWTRVFMTKIMTVRLVLNCYL